MKADTHEGCPCLVSGIEKAYLISTPMPTTETSSITNHAQRLGDTLVRPVMRMTPARKALMRRASKPSFPNISLIVSFRESWGCGDLRLVERKNESGKRIDVL